MNANSSIVSWQLPETLNFAAAAGFLESMRQRLADGDPLPINASDVQILTLSCVQIILAAMRENQISIEAPSRAFVEAFKNFAIDFTPAAILSESADQSEATAEIETAADDQNKIEQEPFTPDRAEPHAMAKRVLTIDDSKTMRDMLMLTLSDAGFDVVQAVDGQDGLDVLERERVDVIVTDINMPRMDGYGVIRHLRANPNYQGMPILVLTTESELEKKNRAREAGATGWLVKPFDPDRLIETIHKVAL